MLNTFDSWESCGAAAQLSVSVMLCNFWVDWCPMFIHELFMVICTMHVVENNDAFLVTSRRIYSKCMGTVFVGRKDERHDGLPYVLAYNNGLLAMQQNSPVCMPLEPSDLLYATNSCYL